MGSRILMVEKDAAIRSEVRQCLAALGHAVLEAESPDHALAAIRSKHPDAVIVDGDRPESSLPIVEALRQGGRKPPILAILGNPSLGAVEDLFRRGVDACLSRPFRKDQLLRKLNTLMEGSSASSEPSLPIPSALYDAFANLQGRARPLGDVAEIFSGVVVRSQRYRRPAPPGPGWSAILTETSLRPWRITEVREFVRFDRIGLIRVPHRYEYDQAEKVILHRSPSPLLAAVDRTRLPISHELYAILPAAGLECGYLLCLLYSRIADFYFHRLRPAGDDRYLHRSDLETFPVVVASPKIQQGLSRIAAECSLLGSLPGMDARRRGLLSRMNTLLFEIYGFDASAVEAMTRLNF